MIRRKNKKFDFLKQNIGICESARDQVVKEATKTLNDPNATEKDKKLAELTLEKLKSVQSQFGKGLRRGSTSKPADTPVKITRKMTEESFSKMFYNEEEVQQERSEAFWKKDCVSMGNIKMKAAFDPETQIDYFYMKKDNQKYSPTLLKLSIVEWEDFYKKLKNIHQQILDTKVGETIPFLQNEYANVPPDSPEFWHPSITVCSKSGSLKVRPFEIDNSLKFRWLAPRSGTSKGYEHWAGPSMTTTFLHINAIIKYLRYLMDNYQPSKK